MKTEIYYDPVKPETRVSIDGAWVSKDNIYGFLFPVRNYLLQTWLEKCGSWQGLKRQLTDFARGDKIELIFTGRETDFNDLKASVGSIDGITLQHRQSDPIAENNAILSKAKNAIEEFIKLAKNSSAYPKVLQNVIKTLEASEKASENWIASISSPGGLTEKLPDGCCCKIEDGFLRSFESLSELTRLTGSMCRSADMICCVIRDEGKFSDYSRYAEQCGMGYRFVNGTSCGAEAEKASNELYSKYGEPFALRQKILGYRSIVSLLKPYYDSYNSLYQEKNNLLEEIKKNNPGIPNQKAFEDPDVIMLSASLNWLDVTRKSYTDLYDAVMNRIISQRRFCNGIEGKNQCMLR